MLLAMTTAKAMQLGGQVTWDAQSLMIDGQRVCPVMGEVHYSRLPAAEWPQAIRRMKEGGVTVIATYVFWNHIEEQEGIFRWDGQRDLRRFIQLCKQEQMPVVLRIGPFCHGEVRCGGIPDWVFSKSLTPTIPHREGEVTKIRVRTEQPEFLELVERLYRQIFTQVQGLQWKDGGPVLACQFDNEYRGDVARLYANGKLIADNFYNGRPFLYGLWRLPAEVNSLELRILPLQPEMPVYFPREADTTPGEAVLNISIINCP